MKIGLPLIFCMLLVSSVSLAQPSIKFDSAEYDFAVISQEDAAEHVFDFTNAGDQELMIEKISPS